MKQLTVFYLCLEALAIMMVLTIFIAAPEGDVLSQFERFGYATASIGITLFILGVMKSHYKVSTAHLMMSGLLLYPLFLWLVYEAVHGSPQLIPQSWRPAALSRAVNVLSNHPGDTEEIAFPDRVNRVQQRYPVPNDLIRQVHLDGIRGLSSFVQSVPDWSDAFLKKTYEDPMRLSVLRNMLNYPKFMKKFDNAYVASLSGILAPLTSRTAQQMGALRYVDPVLYKLLLTHHHSEISNKYAVVLAERRFLTLLKEEIPQLDTEDLPLGVLWSDRLREGLSLAIFEQIGLPASDAKGRIVFPWFESKAQFLSDPSFVRVMAQITPYFISASGETLMSLNSFADESKVERFENHFKAGINADVRDNFLSYYVRTATALGQDERAWMSPLAEPLFGHWLRIGAVLPVMLALSTLLLLLNLWRVCSWGKTYMAAGAVSLVVAYGVFQSALLPLVMELVLLISVPSPVMFVG